MKEHSFGGWILIGLGCFFLLDNLGLIPKHLISDFWPIILILVGGSIVIKGRLPK